MGALHLASEDNLMFIGELLGIIVIIQNAPKDDAVTARDWVVQTIDALADLSGCHEELDDLTHQLRALARKEGGAGVEDTDADSPEHEVPALLFKTG